MMAMKMHWWAQKYVLWSEASNSQRLHCKLIPAGHSAWFPPHICKSQLCKPHTAAQISSLKSHRSILKTSHLILVFICSYYDHTRQYLLKGKRSWWLEPVALQYDQLKKSVQSVLDVTHKRFIQPPVTFFFIDSFHPFFFYENHFNMKHSIFALGYIIIM